jgi:glucose-1-phosphatase
MRAVADRAFATYQDRMKITTLVFDFGNVLGFFSHRQAAEQLAAYSDLAPEAIQAFLFDADLEEAFEAGRLSSAELMDSVRTHCRVHCTEEQFRAAYADMFHPNPDICTLLPGFKERFRLLLLSNTNELHCAQFTRQFADTLGWFDGLVYSHQVGVRKPDRRIFDHCLSLAGCPASECLFIDDLPANIAGAQAAGWQGLVYREGDDLRFRLAALGIS